MSNGVDVIGTLTEKLKQMIEETQEHFEWFTDSHKLYEQDNLNEKEYMTKIIKYVITLSAMNFLSIRVILEIKSSLDKTVLPNNPVITTIHSNPNTHNPDAAKEDEYILPSPNMQDMVFMTSTIEQEQMSTNPNSMADPMNKICCMCSSHLSKTAKFCTACGSSQ
jgi:hypothetical protein